MKILVFIVFICMMVGCSQPGQNESTLQNRLDSLENKQSNAYKPGLGEFMSSIQTHHAKLWFAGQNQNWKLCDFEIHEIMEAFGNIKKFQSERKETEHLDMIYPALDSINNAIQHKDPALFKNSYVLLTSTCNNCHHAVQFEFNVVKIPEVQSFSNQDFHSVSK